MPESHRLSYSPFGAPGTILFPLMMLTKALKNVNKRWAGYGHWGSAVGLDCQMCRYVTLTTSEPDRHELIWTDRPSRNDHCPQLKPLKIEPNFPAVESVGEVWDESSVFRIMAK